jgi:hypothetical protein
VAPHAAFFAYCALDLGLGSHVVIFVCALTWWLLKSYAVGPHRRSCIMASPSKHELVLKATTTSSDHMTVSWELPEDTDPEKPLNW